MPFKVTHPWASFLVGGGPWPETCVELVRKDTKEVFSRTSGVEEENLRRVAVDLPPHMGKEIFIRLVDKHSGRLGAHQLRRLPLPLRQAERAAAQGRAAAARRLQVRRPAAGQGGRRR